MKLHLPLLLRGALLAVMTSLSMSYAEIKVTIDQEDKTMEDLKDKITGIVEITVTGEESAVIGRTAKLTGQTTINLNSGGSLRLEGEVNGDNSQITVGEQGTLTFSLGAFAYGSGSGKILVNQGGTVNCAYGDIGYNNYQAESPDKKTEIVLDGGTWSGTTVRIAQGNGEGKKGDVGIQITNGGQFTMGQGAQIASGTDNGTGAVSINVEQGTFTQEGGSIGIANGTGHYDVDISVDGEGAVYKMVNGNIGKSTGGTSENTIDITVQNNGKFQFEGGEIGLATGDTAKVTVGANGTFEQSGGTNRAATSVEGGTYNHSKGTVDGTVTVSSGTYNQTGGTVNGNITVSGDGTYELAGGGRLGDNVQVAVSGGTLNVKGSTGTKLNLTMTGGTTDVSTGDIVEGSKLNLQSGDATLTLSNVNASITGATVTVGSGTILTQTEGEIINSQLDISGTYNLNDGSVKGTGSSKITVKSGGQVTQAGVASVSDTEIVLDGGSYTQEGDITGGSITLNAADSQYTQNGTISGGSITLQDGTYTQAGSLIDTTVTQTGGTYEQNATVESGGVSVSAGTYKQGAAVSGDVQVSGTAKYEQNAEIVGNVTLADSGSSFTQSKEVQGDVTVQNGTYTQNTDGTITGKVTMQGGTFSAGDSIEQGVSVSGGTFTQKGGTIAGGVTVTGEGSVFTQESSEAAGAINGKVTVENGGAFTLKGKTVSDGVTLSGENSKFALEGGEIHGNVDVSGGTFTQSGGALADTLTLSGGSYNQTGGSIAGATISGGTFTMSDSASVTGTVTLGSRSTGSVVQNGGTVGSVVVSGGSYTASGGTISGDVKLSGGAMGGGSFTLSGATVEGGVTVSDPSKLTITNGSIDGTVDLSGGTVSQSGGSVAGVQQTGGSYTASQGTISGDVAVTGGTFSQSGASVSGAVTVEGSGKYEYSGGSLNTVEIQSGGTMSVSGALKATGGVTLNGGTLSLSGNGNLGDSAVTLSSASSSIDFANCGSTGSVHLQAGELKNAGGFTGDLRVHTEQLETNLGGATAGSLKELSLNTDGAVVKGISAGEIKLTGESNSVSVGTGNVGGQTAIVQFNNNGSGGRLGFADGGKMVLNFAADLLKGHQDKGHVEVSVQLTNGDIALAADQLKDYFVLEEGLLPSTDAGYTEWKVDRGVLTVEVNVDGIIFASEHGTLDASQNEADLQKHTKVYLDADLTLNTQNKDVTLKQLSSGDAEHPHTLTINGTGTVSLENTGGTAGDTVLAGSIVSKEAGLTVAKTGDGSLTITQGKLELVGKLDIQAGKVILESTGNRVGSLAIGSTENTALELAGDSSLTLTGDSTIAGSLTGTGKLILTAGSKTTLSTSLNIGSLSVTGGTLTLENAGAITADEVQLSGGSITAGTGAITGNISVTDGTFTGGAGSITGDVAVSGGKFTGGAGAIKGNVDVSGQGSFMGGEGEIAGNVNISGGTFTGGSGKVSGNVNVTGGKVTGGSGEISGDVTLSGTGSALENTGYTIKGKLLLTGENSSASFTGGGVGTAEATIAESSPTATNVELSGANSKLSFTGQSTHSGTIHMSGTNCSLNLGNTPLGENSAIYMERGTLTNAGSYGGKVNIDLRDAKGKVDLGGLHADRITDLHVHGNEGVNFTGIGDGTLTFNGDANIVVVGTQSVSGEALTVGGGDTKVFDFAADGGQIGFGEGGKLTLQLADEVYQNMVNGQLSIHLSDGSFAGADEDLLTWVKQHFQLRTGDGLVLAGISGPTEAGTNGIDIVLGVIPDNIWVASEEETNVSNDEFDHSSKVKLDKDITVNSSAPNSESTLRQLEGDGNLTLNAEQGKDMTVTLLNENVDIDGVSAVGKTEYSGNITSTGAGKVDLVKDGDAELVLNGNVSVNGALTVKDGKLDLNGAGNSVGALAMPGEGATEGANPELAVNGGLTVNEQSTLSSGTLSGSGEITVEKGLTLGENLKFGDVAPSVKVQKDATLRIDTPTDVTLGGLSGAGDVVLSNADVLTLNDEQPKETPDVFSGKIEFAKGNGTLRMDGYVNQEFDGVQAPTVTLDALSEDGSSHAHSAIAFKGSNTFQSLCTGGSVSVQGHLTTTGDIVFADTSRVTLHVDLADAQHPLLQAGGNVSLSYAQLTVDCFNEANNLDEDPALVLAEGNAFLGSDGSVYTDGSRLENVEFSDVLKLFYDDPYLSIEGEAPTEQPALAAETAGDDAPPQTEAPSKQQLVLHGTPRTDNPLLQYATSFNSTAGADLIFYANKTNARGEVLPRVIEAIATQGLHGHKAEASRIMAATMGSPVTSISSALNDGLRDHLLRMRGYAQQPDVKVDEGKRQFHFWVTPEVNFAKVDSDGDECGYELDSWGGSVGMDMRVLNSRSRAGLAISASYGDIDANAADNASGSIDSYYLSLYAHIRSAKWLHTGILALGTHSADLDRTVNYNLGAYHTNGSTDAFSVGLFYELAYDVKVDKDHRHSLQPYLQMLLKHTAVSGWNEGTLDGKGMELLVDDCDATTFTLGVGTRWVSSWNTGAVNRSVRTELGATIAQDFGDTQPEADVALQANPGFRRTVRGSEAGNTSVQINAGVSVPVSDRTQIFLNVGSTLRTDSTTWGAGLGVRCNF